VRVCGDIDGDAARPLKEYPPDLEQRLLVVYVEDVVGAGEGIHYSTHWGWIDYYIFRNKRAVQRHIQAIYGVLPGVFTEQSRYAVKNGPGYPVQVAGRGGAEVSARRRPSSPGPDRGRLSPQRFRTGYRTFATISISTRAPAGRPATCTVARAGYGSSKYSL